MQVLRSYLDAFHPLPEAAFGALVQRLEPVAYARRAVMTAQGETQRNLLFILEGIQYSYYLDEAGRQHVVAFTYPLSVSGLPESFLTQRPARYSLEALTDTQALGLSFGYLQLLYDEFPPIERLFRKLAETLLIGMVERQHEWLSTSAEERFRNLARRSPHLFSQVPHRLLASYLRIDATNFSRFFNSVKF
ncbi:MAG: Crp/Fnr family transcriptional regulator [Sphingobacteriaceae bacterium]|nr:Crp/Fnr family transcriptional regulator [Cytophagaceae bacterium]